MAKEPVLSADAAIVETSETKRLSFTDVKAMASRFLKTALFVLGGLLVLSTFLFLSGHQYIAKTWPLTQTAYHAIGLSSSPAQNERLVLQNISSERRYEDGAMQLIVQGEIKNVSKKPQGLPDLNVDAMGPDERIIQSWRIKPSPATLEVDSVLPFTSAILSPEGTVVEVNLSFVETPHDQP
jgi:hypothetical protein